MKEGWEIRKLGDVATSHFNINWKKCEEQKEYVDLSSIDRESHQITETQLIDKQNAPSRAQRIIKTNDILFATTRPTLRRFCIVPDNLNNQVCSSGLCVIRPKEKNVCSKWIYMLLLMDSFYKYIEPIQKGASYPAVVDSDVFSYPIPIPPLSEQQRIVSKLDSAFEKIDALKANAENNLKNAKDLFQQVLKKELEPKEGWSEKRMIEIADLCLGKMLDKQKNKGIKQPYLRNVNVRWGSFDCSDILEMPFEKDEETRYSIIKNDIVMCEGGEPGRCAIWTSEKSIKFQKALHRIRCKKDTNPQFLYYTFLMFYNSGQLKKHYSGTTILHLTGEKLKEIFISLPSLSEQQRIVSILDSLSEKCKRLEENYSKTLVECDALKQSILREVMSEK